MCGRVAVICTGRGGGGDGTGRDIPWLCAGTLAVICLGGWQWFVWEQLLSFVWEPGSAICLGGGAERDTDVARNSIR